MDAAEHEKGASDGKADFHGLAGSWAPE
jgi:hypothetical protein